MLTTHPFKANSKEHKALPQVPQRQGHELSDMEIHDKQQDASSTLTDSTEKVLNCEYPEFYSSTVILLLILREGKRGCVAGLFGIKDRTRIVQEAELFMVAARHVALKRPPHGALRFSRTRVQGFSGIPALEMSVNSSGSTQN